MGPVRGATKRLRTAVLLAAAIEAAVTLGDAIERAVTAIDAMEGDTDIEVEADEDDC